MPRHISVEQVFRRQRGGAAGKALRRLFCAWRVRRRCARNLVAGEYRERADQAGDAARRKPMDQRPSSSRQARAGFSASLLFRAARRCRRPGARGPSSSLSLGKKFGDALCAPVERHLREFEQARVGQFILPISGG